MFIFKLKYKSQVWVWKATEKFLSLVRSWCAVWGRWARLRAPPGGIGASRSAAMAPEGAGQGPPSSDTFPWSQRHILRQQRHSPSSHPHPAPLASQFVSPFWSLHPLAPMDDHAVQVLCLSRIFCGPLHRWDIQNTLFFANISFSCCSTSCQLHATYLGGPK